MNIRNGVVLFSFLLSIAYADVTITVINKTGHDIKPKIHQRQTSSWSWSWCGTAWERFFDVISASQIEPVQYSVGNIIGCHHTDEYWVDFEIRDESAFPYPLVKTDTHCFLGAEEKSAQVTIAVNEHGSYTFDWVCPT